MDLQLQELLDRIKTEGVEAARTEASRIVSDAGQKASAMLAEAERKAAVAEKEAAARIASMESASRSALEQASRDTILGLRKKVQAFVETLVKSDASKAFGPAMVEKVLPSILEKLASGVPGGLEVFLSPEALSEIDAGLAARMSAELGKGVEFKPLAGLDAGLRIAGTGESVQYDFSADAVASLVSARVNARLAESVRAAAKGI